MLRRFRLLFLCLAASSLLAMTTAHACETTVELGAVCLVDCDRQDNGDTDPALSHGHGCQGQSAFVPTALPVGATAVAAVDHQRHVGRPLLPHDAEPALRPPAA